mgnify:CR=1 FL=1
MSQGNKKNEGFANKFSRKVLGLDRPLTVKEKMKARIKADELYVRLTEPPKGYAMSDKTHTERQRAKSRASSYKRHLQK